jgi:hypothetical protein
MLRRDRSRTGGESSMTHHPIDPNPAEGVVVFEAPGGLRFEKPLEPSELRVRLRETALGVDGQVAESQTEDEDGLSNYQSFFGAWLWERWRATLEPVGVARETFIEVVGGYKRELWLWIVGDRGWEQMLSGLAGRVSRRLLVV